MSKWLVWVIFGPDVCYYVGDNAEGQALWHRDPKRQFLVDYDKMLKLERAHGAKRCSVGKGQCHRCGSEHVVVTYVRECYQVQCVGCHLGVSSHLYDGRKPIQNCSQCGTPIYNAELFRGPVCPKCGFWC